MHNLIQFTMYFLGWHCTSKSESSTGDRVKQASG